MEVKVIADTVFAAPGGSVIFPVTFDPEWLDVEPVKQRLFPIPTVVAPMHGKAVAQPGGAQFTVVEPVFPGEVWMFGMRPRGAQNLLAWKTIFCVRKPQEGVIELSDSTGVEASGTFCTLRGGASDDVFARMWVSADPIPDAIHRPPLIDETNPNFGGLRQQIARRKASAGGTIFGAEFAPLAPGTTYNYLIQFMNKIGTLRELSGAFTTRMRRVAVSVSELRIRDDGDDWSSGEAEFRISVQKDGVVIPTSLRSIGDNRHPVSVDDTIPSRFKLDISEVVGPEPGGFSVGINAHGREFDSFSDELASTSGDQIMLWAPYELPMEAGRGETFRKSGTIKAPNVNDTSFSFELDYAYDVSYV